MHKLQIKIESPIGPLYLVGTEHSLQGIFWEKQDVPMINRKSNNTYLHKVVTQLKEYFEGKRTKFTLRLETEGTKFQKAVWNELMNIPYGETRSYKEIAIAIKNAKACRAVGTANGKNPIAIIIPCHRVIAHDGSIGGYGGGLPIKKKLLKLEKEK